MCNPESVVSKGMIETVCLGHGAVFIKQERGRSRMLTEILRWVPDAFAFFGRDVNQAGSELLDLFFERLQLSHALAAVRSPRAAEEFDDERALRNQIRKRKTAIAIRSGQRKQGRGRT